MGYEIVVRHPMPNYTGPYDGPTFDELLWRVLYANLDAFAWLWIEGAAVTYDDLTEFAHEELSLYTHDQITRLHGNTVDLNTLTTTGCFVMHAPSHYVPGYEHISPINIFNEYIDGIFFMITTIGPDIWYRVYDENTGIWTPWFLQSFCTIIRGIDPPEEFTENDLWLRLPNGDRPEYTLFGYYNEKWIEIGKSRWLTQEIYDPRGIQRNIFEYLQYMMKTKLGVLSTFEAPMLEYIYKSECYAKVAFKFIVNGYYYFFINPEDIYVDSELSQNRFYVIRYDPGLVNPVQLEGLQFNIRQMVVSKYNRFYLISENGQIYHSTDAITWNEFPLNYVTHEDLNTKYRHLDLRGIPYEEIPHINNPQLQYDEIELIDMTEPGFVYFFTKKGDMIVEMEDLVYRIWIQNGIPAEYLCKDMIQWHDKLLVTGYNEDGTRTNVYYISLDDGETWRPFLFPVFRKWTHFFIYDDMCIVTTGDQGTAEEPQTYCAQYNEDPHTWKWLLAQTEAGGNNIAERDWIPIKLTQDEEGRWKIEYLIHRSIELLRTTYHFLHRYLHDELYGLTHDEIKWMRKEILDTFETIYLDQDKVQFPSLSDMDNTNFGVIFDNEDGTLGFQGVHFISYVKAFEDHINDWDRHLTPDDREKISHFITREKADEILLEMKRRIDDFTDDKLEDINYDAKYEDLKNVVDEFLNHALDYTIHITKDQRKYYDDKAEADHTHFLDDRVTMHTKNVSGMLNPLRIPKQFRRKMKTVTSMEKMYELNKDMDEVYNGYVIRVLPPEEYKPDMPLNGRFFWVLDDDNLDLEESYVEFTVTSDDILVYWEEISDAPTTKSGYGITDVPTYDEMDEERKVHDKMIFGYELLSMDYIQSVIKNSDKVGQGTAFLKENRIKGIPDCTTCTAQIMGEWMEALCSYPIPLDIGNTHVFNYGTECTIADIQYSDRTKEYFLYTHNGNGECLQRLDYRFNLISAAYGSGAIGKLLVKPIYPTLELWFWGDSTRPSFVYDREEKKKCLELPAECINFSHDSVIEFDCNMEDYRTFIFVNHELKLGFLKVDEKCSYDFRVFSNKLDGAVDFRSLYYDSANDLLTVIVATDKNNTNVIQYYGMSMILQSFQYFDLVDMYLDDGVLDKHIQFSDIIPEKKIIKSKNKFIMEDYLGYWNQKHVSVVYSSTYVNEVKSNHHLSFRDDMDDPDGYVLIDFGDYDRYTMKPDIFLYNDKAYLIWVRTDISTIRVWCLTDNVEVTYGPDRVLYPTSIQIPGLRGVRFCNGYLFAYSTDGLLLRFSPDQCIGDKYVERAITIVSENPRYTKDQMLFIPSGNELTDNGYIYLNSRYSLSIKAIENIYHSKISLSDMEYTLRTNTSFTKSNVTVDISSLPSNIKRLFSSPNYSIASVPNGNGGLKEYGIVAQGNNVVLIDKADPTQYFHAKISTMENIVETGCITLKNSYPKDDYYSFLIFVDEVKEKKKKEVTCEFSWEGNTFRTNFVSYSHAFPYTIYFIPISSDAIIDLFQSNYAILQETQNSVYSQVETIIDSIEEDI